MRSAKFFQLQDEDNNITKIVLSEDNICIISEGTKVFLTSSSPDKSYGVILTHEEFSAIVENWTKHVEEKFKKDLKG